MTPPADAASILSMALGASLAVNVLLGHHGWRCRCSKCAVHVAEAKINRERAAELSHDTEHKGFGWTRGAPDVYDCRDDACKRNPSKSKVE